MLHFAVLIRAEFGVLQDQFRAKLKAGREMAMEDWQQRVVDEKRELDEKLKKLRAFLDSKRVLSLDARDVALMAEQEGYMLRYSMMLEGRIARFKS